MSHPSLILPYVVKDADRKKAFTYDMEVASILFLAESKRKKLKILGVSPERISFILKLHYPLWAIPWGNKCLVMDGLGILSHSVVHMKLPDIKLFTEDIKRSTTVRRLFREVLKNHAETFKDFTATDEVSLKAVIASKKFLTTIFKYIKPEVALKENITHPIVLAPPKLGKEAALEKAEKLITHWRRVQSEIKSLRYVASVLSEETKFHEQKILHEIEQVRNMYENEILRIEPIVEKRIERLMKKRDDKISRILGATEKKLNAALSKKDKQEEKLQRLERSRGNFEKKREARKRRGDKVGEAYWNRKIGSYQHKISDANKKIQALTQLVERTRKESENAIKKVNDDHQAMVDGEREKVANLEASQNKDVEAKQKEMKELRSESSSIINLIAQLIEKKRLQLSKIEETRIPWHSEAVTLVCVPVYLLRYETEKKYRHQMLMPVVAMDHRGIIKKIQRTIWSFSLESRIKLLLRPREKALETLASTFAKTMRKNKAFGKNVYKLGYDNNLLRTPKLREALAKGIEELENEGWVSSEEKDGILNAYAPQRMR